MPIVYTPARIAKTSHEDVLTGEDGWNLSLGWLCGSIRFDRTHVDFRLDIVFGSSEIPPVHDVMPTVLELDDFQIDVFLFNQMSLQIS